jgi:D-amino-acid dehydrogenase
MEVLGPLGHSGRRLFDELVEEEGLDCEFRTDGYYEVYRTPEGFQGARKEIPLQREHGYDTQALKGPALEELEPALRPGTEGALFFPEAATLDPGRFMTELARAGEGQGLAIRTGAEVAEVVKDDHGVRGIRLADGEVLPGKAVVLATGAYSADLTRAVGLDLHIQPAKGYHQDLPLGQSGPPELNITMMLGERFVFCTPMGDFLRLAGTLELSGSNHNVVRRRLSNLQDSARTYLDGMEECRSQDDWVGIRPVTPDGLPTVGPVPGLDGLWVANGHAMLGLTLGPITGKLLAEWILHGAPSEDIAALSPDRF